MVDTVLNSIDSLSKKTIWQMVADGVFFSIDWFGLVFVDWWRVVFVTWQNVVIAL